MVDVLGDAMELGAPVLGLSGWGVGDPSDSIFGAGVVVMGRSEIHQKP